MNKNRGLTPLAVVLMLSGSLALTGCDDKPAQQGAQHADPVGFYGLGVKNIYKKLVDNGCNVEIKL